MIEDIQNSLPSRLQPNQFLTKQQVPPLRACLTKVPLNQGLRLPDEMEPASRDSMGQSVNRLTAVPLKKKKCGKTKELTSAIKSRNTLSEFLAHLNRKEEPFGDFIKVTSSAFSSAKECEQWQDCEILMDHLMALSGDLGGLIYLGPHATQSTLHPRKGSRGKVFSSLFDIKDNQRNLTLRLHFFVQKEKMHLGWCEEL